MTTKGRVREEELELKFGEQEKSGKEGYLLHIQIAYDARLAVCLYV